jgi:plastocyanin
MTRSIFLAVGVAAGAALGACTIGPPPAPVVHRVTMIGSFYSPATVNARVGDTLQFVNDDTETHAVFVPTRGFGLDLGNQRPSENREIVLAAAGRFTVECVPHADMNLVVNVR